MDFTLLIFILEIIGTIAFTISGVMVAKEKKMDLFGAVVLGGATAVGGGMIRDVILGSFPPTMFTNPIYILVSLIVSFLTFSFFYFMPKSSNNKTKELVQLVINWADNVGLAAFVVVGCRLAISSGFANNLFLCTFVGTLTGIGGGIIRDVLAGQVPLIFAKRIYGLAAILGAYLYMTLYALHLNNGLDALISMCFIVVIRFFAMHYKWNLPSFK